MLCAMLAGIALAPLVGAASVTVFYDDFEDGNRAGWFNSSGGGNALLVGRDASEHRLKGNALKAINSGATGVLHFPARTLAVGESLTIGFSLSLASVGNVDGNLRFVLLDSSGGAQVNKDENNLDRFANYQGYRVFTNAGSDVNGRTSLAKRNPAVATGLTTGSGWSTFDGSSTNGVGLEAGTAYIASITYKRIGVSSLQVIFTMNGVVSQATDQAATSFTFDTFGYSKGGSNGNLHLDDVLVTHGK